MIYVDFIDYRWVQVSKSLKIANADIYSFFRELNNLALNNLRDQVIHLWTSTCNPLQKPGDWKDLITTPDPLNNQKQKDKQ